MGPIPAVTAVGLAMLAVTAADTYADPDRDVGVVSDALVGGAGLARPDARLQHGCQLVTGASNRVTLDAAAVPGSVQVGLRRDGGAPVLVPPSRRDGFDYSGPAEGLRLYGANAPLRPDDLLIVGYRRWSDPPPPCPAPLVLDSSTGVCDCDPDACAACGQDVCDATCACTCDRSQAARCERTQRWDPASCACL